MQLLDAQGFLQIQNFGAKSHTEVVIDVRSPSEFAHSHIPGARNLPVLSDEERSRVGALYKHNPFEAKLLGAALICQNIAHFLPGLGLTPAHIIRIYCARGGMRSLSLQTILANIGYRTIRLQGGYKAYRNAVLYALAQKPNMQFFTLIGPTGSGKSELLALYENSLDIESLAKHCGSSFGAIYGVQPSVAMFENTLYARLMELEGKKVLVEGESKKLGNLIVPKALYDAYQRAPKIYIHTPLELRIRRILHYYQHIDEEFFAQAMQKIAPFMQKRFWLEAKEAFAQDDKHRVAQILLEHYYDRVYKKEAYTHRVDSSDLHEALEQVREIMARY
ncbi:tRNA 2-selenouridine(34) synthase MnmH [uncultured Helicobacter sp.]|uniref:tRNA 2-selenouridine(34) synthase MnmH n=1 Tax=uncultured Helicobacter sp. TaxID=175537 RepID=UPI00374E7294